MKASDIFVHRDPVKEQVKVENAVVQVAEVQVREVVPEVVPEVIKPSQNGCPPPPPPIIVIHEQHSVPSLQFDLVEDLVGSSDEEDMKRSEDHESGLPDSVTFGLLSCVATFIFNVLLLHAVTFSK